jgi:hypothetical protein
MKRKLLFGSSNLKEKAVKGDKIKVYYVEQEFFDPKTNSYQKYNEITEIKLL